MILIPIKMINVPENPKNVGSQAFQNIHWSLIMETYSSLIR